MIGSLGELVALAGMPSEPTVRKMIADNADFPVVSRGKNGVAYEFDLAAAAAFVRSIREREEVVARARAEEVRQFGLDLLGPDAVAQPQIGLTAVERRALLEEEMAAIRLAERRGDLVRRAEAEIATAELVVLVSDRLDSLPARLAKRTQVPRETLAVLEEIIRADKAGIADVMQERAVEAVNAVSTDPQDSVI